MAHLRDGLVFFSATAHALPMRDGPPAVLDFFVIDESDDYLVVGKPAPLIVHPANGKEEPTLLCGVKQILAFEGANGHQPAIITRLDRETSGLVLIAKHTKAASTLATALQNRDAHKEYLAIAHGWPTWENYDLDAPIQRKGLTEQSAIWLRRAVHPAGQPSRTSFDVLQRWENAMGKFSLLRCHPITGRTHQIRVHLEFLGHPIVGDKIYGRDDETFLRWIEDELDASCDHGLFLPRHALHASRLRIPWEGAMLDWHCDLSSDLAEWMKPLRSR
jgi:23S rRNA pseudouridine1911/1915/1917 synthase